MYKYLLFDADNTLLDFDLAEKCALKETLKLSPLGFTDEIHSRYHVINDREWKRLERGETTRDILRVERFSKLYEEFGMDGDEYGKTTADVYTKMLSCQSQLMPDAEYVIETLSHKYDIYIVTNGITEVQKKRTESTPLIKYVKHSFISEEMGCAKPSPVFFDMVIDSVGDPERKNYLVIGDSLTSDIAGAVASSIDSVLISPDGQISDIPTYTVQKLTDILELL